VKCARQIQEECQRHQHKEEDGGDEDHHNDIILDAICIGSQAAEEGIWTYSRLSNLPQRERDKLTRRV
jgi:hypothetical protein